MIRQAAACSSQQSKCEAQKVAQLRKIAEERHERAKQAYKSVMSGKGWVSTSGVEKLMGYKHGSCSAALKKFVEDGAVERRPLNGGPFNRRKGWEFMWIEE